jgi:glycine/D-amino acid oxidase-like deaminating enzyme
LPTHCRSSDGAGLQGLWLAFGHSHLGFTLGPPTGRLIAEMMSGESRSSIRGHRTFRADRF